MHGPGEPGKHGNDEDIANLYVSGTPENVELATALLHKRHGLRTIALLCVVFRGLKFHDAEEIYNSALYTVANRALNGRFVAKPGGTGALGLLKTIVGRRAVDFLRKKGRRSIVAYVQFDSDDCPCVDDSWDFENLMNAIEDQLQDLACDRQIVLRTYVELVSDGHASITGRMPLALFRDVVNKSIRQATLTNEEVQSFWDEGLRKLRKLWNSGKYGADSIDTGLVGFARLVLQSLRQLAPEQFEMEMSSLSGGRTRRHFSQPEGLKVEIGSLPLEQVTEAVNNSICFVELTGWEVRLLFDCGRDKLRSFLWNRGIQP